MSSKTSRTRGHPHTSSAGTCRETRGGEEWKKKRQGKGEKQETMRQEKDGDKAGTSGNYRSGKVGKGKEGVKKGEMWGSEEEEGQNGGS